LSHAHEWILFENNIGPFLTIDETSLSHGELYTILTNKAGKGKRGALVAMIKGTKAEDVINILKKIPEFKRRKVKEVTLDMAPNMEMIINAGVDQMGSETETQLVVELVNEGKVSEERINQAASRILQWHFLLGLFENPYVDVEAADSILQSEENQAAGYEAQLKSIVLLTNNGALPAKKGIKVYVEGIEKEAVAKFATVVEKPAEADLILVRTSNTAPRTGGGFGGGGQQATEVNIDYPKEYFDNIKKLKATGKPVVAAVNVSGSWVVLPEEWEKYTDASFMLFDPLDDPFMEVVFGDFNPVGKMPFEIPISMEAVRNNQEDVPFDTQGKYKFGHGLSY